MWAAEPMGHGVGRSAGRPLAGPGLSPQKEVLAREGSSEQQIETVAWLVGGCGLQVLKWPRSRRHRN